MALKKAIWEDEVTTKQSTKIKKAERLLKSCGIKVTRTSGKEDEITGIESLAEYLNRTKPSYLPLLEKAIGRTVCLMILCSKCENCPGRGNSTEDDKCRQKLGRYLRTRRGNRWK